MSNSTIKRGYVFFIIYVLFLAPQLAIESVSNILWVRQIYFCAERVGQYSNEVYFVFETYAVEVWVIVWLVCIDSFMKNWKSGTHVWIENGFSLLFMLGLLQIKDVLNMQTSFLLYPCITLSNSLFTQFTIFFFLLFYWLIEKYLFAYLFYVGGETNLQVSFQGRRTSSCTGCCHDPQ